MRSILPCSDSWTIPSSPLKLEWKIGLPWANTWGRLCSPSKLENPATTRETPRGFPVIARWGPCPLQRLKRSTTFRLEVRNGIGTLDATSKVPRHTGLTSTEEVNWNEQPLLKRRLGNVISLWALGAKERIWWIANLSATIILGLPGFLVPPELRSWGIDKAVS